MWTRAQLKQNAKIAYRRNYWLCVLVSLIVSVLGGIVYSWPGIDITSFRNTNSWQELETTYQSAYSAADWKQFMEMLAVIVIVALIVGVIVAIGMTIFLGNLVSVGSCRFYMENREYKTSLTQVFYGFRDGRYAGFVKTMFVRGLIIVAYKCLFLVPGIIKSYAYRLVPYILADNDQIDRRRALELSEAMMYGHKWEAFVFDLSFIGWKIAGMLSGGLLNLFIVEPYIAATYAEYYTALKSEAIYKGITTRSELPGVGMIVAEETEEVVEECL